MFGFPSGRGRKRPDTWSAAQGAGRSRPPRGNCATCRANEAESDSARGVDWVTHHGDASESCLEVGLQSRRNGAWGGFEVADDPG